MSSKFILCLTFVSGDAEDRQQVDWDKYNLAQQAFITCNNDGEEGLTWNEIRSCEVKGNMIINNIIY